MESHAGVKRDYRSPRRDAVRRETRRAILGAAGRLFAERGFVGASFDAIAAAAGVSRATVFAHFSSKAELLKAAYDVILVGDDEPIALPDRPESVRIRADPDAHRFLMGYAAIVAGVHRRLAPIHEAIRAAANSDADAADVWRAIQAERRRGSENVVEEVRRRGSLRTDATPPRLADVVYVLVDAGTYATLVADRGWAHEAYADWLGRILVEQLIG